MIKPHGSDTLNPLYVADDTERAALIKEAENLPAILISSGAAASAVMLGSGYFNPLTGYMNLAEATSIAQDMTLPNGLLWPVPVMNIVKAEQVTDVIKNADRIALLDPNVDSQSPIAVMEVAGIEEISDDQRTYLIEQIFRTTDPSHPGVEAFTDMGNQVISGSIQVLNYSYFRSDFPDTFRTASEIREDIEKRGWDTVVAFQTRNPMHRAHEELCKIAQNEVDADGSPDSHAAWQAEAGRYSCRCPRRFHPQNGRVVFPRKYRLNYRLWI